MKVRKLIDLVIPEGRWRRAVVSKEAGLSGITRSACKQRNRGALLKQQEKTIGRNEEDTG